MLHDGAEVKNERGAQRELRGRAGSRGWTGRGGRPQPSRWSGRVPIKPATWCDRCNARFVPIAAALVRLRNGPGADKGVDVNPSYKC